MDPRDSKLDWLGRIELPDDHSHVRILHIEDWNSVVGGSFLTSGIEPSGGDMGEDL